MMIIWIRALTFEGPSRDNLVLHPLDVLHLDNQLYTILFFLFKIVKMIKIVQKLKTPDEPFSELVFLVLMHFLLVDES